MTHARRSLALIAATGLVVAGSGIAGAQLLDRSDTDDSPLVVHEYFDPDTAFFPSAVAPGDLSEMVSDGSALVHDGVQIPRPAGGDSDAAEHEASHAPEGPRDAEGVDVPRRNGPGNANSNLDGFALDADTDMEGTLNYKTVFNPSVVPFKRGGVMNQIVVRSGRYRLALDDRDWRPIPVRETSDAAEGYDLFWAELVVEGEPGREIPIPSVAPGAGIMAVETIPEGIEVAFVRDGADNVAVRTNHRGTFRLSFMTDASRRYFYTDVPNGIPLDAPPRDLPTDFVGVSADMHGVAEQIATTVGVSREMTLDIALPRLVEYFRDFQADSLQERPTGDLMLDIALTRKGVCRHRAFAFMLAAQWVHIPTRYVYNEAHAFVEVFVSGRGWTRIDLGGGAERLEVASNDDTVRHNAGEDRFPQPDNYLGSYSQVARDRPAVPGDGGADGDGLAGFGEVDGLPRLPDEVDEVASDDPDSTAPFATGSGADAASTGSAESDVERAPGEPVAADGDVAPTEPMATMIAEPAPPAGDPSAVEAADPDRGVVLPADAAAMPTRAAPVLRLDPIPEVVRRGEPLTLSGQLAIAEGDVPLAARTVEIVLAQSDAAQMETLGSAETDELGRFTTTVTLPQTLPVGRWDLYARFPGDPDNRAVRSD